MSIRESVEIHYAFTWDCDRCGHENFTRGYVIPIGAEDVVDVTGDFDHGVDESLELSSHVTMPPDVVTCDFCGASFMTLDPFEADHE